MQLVIQCFFAAIVYYYILPYRGTVEAYLLGWGGILPLSICTPYLLLEWLDVRNKAIKFVFCNLMGAVAFRCMEAMYGTTTPEFIESSLGYYCLYYSTCVPYEWDSKSQTVRKVAWKETLSKIWLLLVYFMLQSLLLSFLIHVHFEPFPSPVVIDDYHLTWDLLSPNHLLNGYLIFLLIYFVLLISFEGMAFGENVKGFATVPTFSNPVFASTSLVDFWTRRWDVTIHKALKVRNQN